MIDIEAKIMPATISCLFSVIYKIIFLKRCSDSDASGLKADIIFPIQSNSLD